MNVKLMEIDHSIIIAIGIADEFNLEPTAFLEIAAFHDAEHGRTEEAIREIFSQARKVGLQWHNIQHIMKYIQLGQRCQNQQMLGVLEIVRNSMLLADYFQIGCLEALRLLSLFSRHHPIKVRLEFTKAYNRKFKSELKWSEIYRLIMTDKQEKEEAIKILHSQFI